STLSAALGLSLPVPGFSTFDARPLAVFSASAGGAFTSGGAGMSSRFGGGGVGAGGVTGVVAADGGVSFGGADFSHAAPVASNSKMQERLIIGCVMPPKYHGRARRGSVRGRDGPATLGAPWGRWTSRASIACWTRAVRP